MMVLSLSEQALQKMKPDQLGLMSENMLQIVRSALEEEQASDAIETLNSAFIQGQVPTREIFFTILAIVFGAPDMHNDEVELDLHDRQIGRFEWSDLGPSVVISAMMLLKRWFATNPQMFASYLFDTPTADTISDGWLVRYSIDGGSASDSEDTGGGAPLVPLLRLASQMQACEDVWQVLSLHVPQWSKNGGLSTSQEKKTKYTKLHEGDSGDEEEDGVESSDGENGRLQRMGVWRLLYLFASLWPLEVTDDASDALSAQLLRTKNGKNRRLASSLTGLDSAINLIVTGLSSSNLWHSRSEDVIDPSNITITLLESIVRRCNDSKDRGLLVKRISDCFSIMDAGILVDLADVSEEAIRVLLIAALRHLDVFEKDLETVVDGAEVMALINTPSSSTDQSRTVQEALEIARSCHWLRLPGNWTTLEGKILADRFDDGQSQKLRKATEAIVNSPAWTLELGNPILASRSRSKYMRASSGLEVLVEATSTRVETFSRLTRRIEIQTFVCNALSSLSADESDRETQDLLSSLSSICARAVCKQGLRDTKELRSILQRMRFSYAKLANEALSVKRSTAIPPSLYKKPKLASSVSSFDEETEDSVEEVHVPEMFTLHLAQCKALLSELSLLLDRTEANLETLELQVVGL